MSTKVYHIYLNNLLVDTLLITDRELSEINIKDVIANVETYEYYQDEYENDFYKINNKDIVSFNLAEEAEKVVVDTDKEEEIIGAEELKEKYYNICLKVAFNEHTENRELYEYFRAQMRLIEDITDMDLKEIKEKAIQKAKSDFKLYMCY